MRDAGLKIMTAVVAAALVLSGCGSAKSDLQAQAPPPAQVEREQDGSLVQVDHPEQIPLATATAYTTTSALTVTGSVTPDISRNVPVVSLVSGRVVAIHARLGDTVQKDQVLLSIRSDDVSGGFSDYRKAIADEVLASKQYDRAKDLFAHGAIAQNDLEVAQDTETKAKVDVETIAEHLRLLGNDPDHPNYIVDVKAPVDGVITDQEVTNAASVQAYGTNPFTISNLSSVWVVCDVYENDLASVHVGDGAQITLNAYPGRMIPGRISNIGAILDPTLRTAKVRIEVSNPGMMRIGMFVTATFRGQKQEQHAEVPASAILHLHDRDWVFAITPDEKFRRSDVTLGATLPGDMQEVLSGLSAGTQVVRNALTFQNMVDQ